MILDGTVLVKVTYNQSILRGAGIFFKHKSLKNDR